MDKNSLRKLIADKLGISSSKKEFAFDAFLKKISESLEPGDALNVPGVGYFQLKNEPLLKGERKSTRGGKKLTKRTMFFSPEDTRDKDESSLFLSFDVEVEDKDFTEFDESVFSLGIQKPIAPIFEEDESLASLQKSLESRIDDVIHNSEKLNDFDLFENYVNQIEEDEENIAEPQTEEPEILGIPDDFLEDTEPETAPLQEPEIEDFEESEKERISEEPEEQIEESEEEKNPFDELDEIKFDEEESLDEVKEETLGSEEPETIEENIEQGIEPEQPEEIIEENKEEKKEVKKTPAPSFEELFENDDDLLESVLPAPEDGKADEKIIVDDEDDEESIEWDWGDELKAEFQEDPEEQKSEELNEEKSADENIDDENDESIEENLEADIADIKIDEDDLNIEDEPEEIEDEDPDLALAKGLSETIDDDFDDESEETPKEEVKEKPVVEKKERKLPSFKSIDWKTQTYGKSFWILLSVFVLFTVFGLYYLLFWGGEPKQVAEIKDMPADTTIVEDTSSQQEIAKVDTGEVITTEPINVAAVETPKVIEETPKTLYRTVENETRINSRIYSDGKKYMIQVSSFKSKGRAENDATRYQAMGYDAFIVEAYLPQLGGTWYRVRIGYYDSVQEAEDVINKNNL